MRNVIPACPGGEEKWFGNTNKCPPHKTRLKTQCRKRSFVPKNQCATYISSESGGFYHGDQGAASLVYVDKTCVRTVSVILKRCRVPLDVGVALSNLTCHRGRTIKQHVLYW